MSWVLDSSWICPSTLLCCDPCAPSPRFLFLALDPAHGISHRHRQIAAHRLHHNTRVGGNTGPQLSGLLTDGAGNGGALHLTLGVDDLKPQSSAIVQAPFRCRARRYLATGSFVGRVNLRHQRCPRSTGRHRQCASRAWTGGR